jgi:hypothetical protein
MKKIILLLFLAVFLLTGNAHASFPVTVEKENVSTTEFVITTHKPQNSQIKLSRKLLKKSPSPIAPNVDEDMIFTLFLFVFFGWLAAHRWYHNKPAFWNLLFILTLGGFGLWYLVDLINILTYNF